MDLTLGGLLAQARDTLANPREGARRILALNLPAGLGWDAIILMSVLSTILVHVVFAFAPSETQVMFGPAMATPIRTAVLQALITGLTVLVVHRVGRARGGRGTLAQAVALMAWLQFILLILQAAQVVALVLLPPAALFIEVAWLGAFFWVLTHFVAELHGFRSLWRTFGGIVVTMMAATMALAVLIAPFAGLLVPGVP